MTESNQKDQNVNEFNRFLQNNAEFLVEKYDQYFKKSSLAIKQFNKQAGIKYIYDVFSFSKYQQDQKMNATLQKSLSKNIEDFLGGLAKKKQQFNSKTAVQMLKFCIQNNQMFAVKYDKKDKKLKTQQQMGESAVQLKQQADQQKQQNQQEQKEEKQNQENQNNEQQKKQQQQQKSKPKEQQIKNESKDLSNMINQFDHLQSPLHKVVDPELIKKNLKIMFEFFCRQQQNLGVHATFDRINRQCNTMTLGKFMAFSNQTGILNDKLDKSLLIRKFKQVAEGRKQIQFDQFYQLAQTLSAIDQSLIPKLGVTEKTGFKSKLKQRLFPFNTRQAAARDVHQANHKIFIPKLTSHSGKLQDQLQIQLKKRKQLRAQGGTSSLRKSKITNTQNSTQSEEVNEYSDNGKRYDASRIRQSSQVMMVPTKLVNGQLQDIQHDMSFLQKVINAEDTDQQWLKQYKIPHKKVSSMVHPRLMNRKESIVSNLKKRVEELEKRQTGKTNQMQKRQYMSHNRHRQRVSKSILN